jgi:hypothetical protein
MLDFELVASFLGRFTQISDEISCVEEIVDPNFMVRKNLNNFTKPRDPFV